MRFRKLRIAWTVICGIACMLLIALWARSYWWADFVQPWRAHSVVSVQGTLFVDKKIVLETSSTNIPAGLVETNRFFAYSLQTQQFDFFPQSSGLAVPYWLIAASTAALAVAPWLPWRYSLRTLLIATTLIAVVLGTITVLNR